jgi:DNA-binding transcriptional LysR family regulator
LASPQVAAGFAKAEGRREIAVWSLASHSPIYGRMRDAIVASGIAQQPVNLCNNVRMMIDIAKTGGGIGIFPEPMVQSDMADGTLTKVTGMPRIPPVEFHVAKRLFDQDPLTEKTFDRASLLQMSKQGDGCGNDD